MRYIQYAFVAVLAVVLITIALANRQMVTLHLLPDELEGFLGMSWKVSMPLFIVVLLGIVVGVVVGFIREWIREHKFRAHGKRAERAAVALSQEVKTLKAQNAKPGDDVLALLE